MKLRRNLIFFVLIIFLVSILVGGYWMQQESVASERSSSSNIFHESISIDVNKKGIAISPMLYGAFFEDINSGADGGLYAELVQNRSFEFPDGLQSWDISEIGNDKVEFSVEDKGSISSKNPHYLRVQVNKIDKGVKIVNYGYNGITIKSGESYRLSLYARSPNNKINTIIATIEDDNGKIGAKVEVKGITNAWKQYELTFKAANTISDGQLVIKVAKEGILDLDMVSLFPQKTWKNRKNGLRYDIAKLIADLKPAFLRFPGGCIVEGRTMATAYRWENTIGDISERPTIENLWGYYQSFGLGFYEYFQFCEDIGAEPVPVINCGMACQARNGDMVDINKLDEYIQDALDLIEFANGDVNTKWGSVRAKLGHPKPFNLKFIAIGNEQWGTDYYIRYEKFYDAIKKKYPNIKMIFAAGPAPSGKIFDDAWAWAKMTKKADIIDEHYYMAPEWFLMNTDRYSTYDRKGPKVFVGEYAAHGLGRRNNLEAALAEAAYLLGLEKNSDVVLMASYAPLLAKQYATQWEPTLIKFNNEMAYATPNYYVQKIFNENKGKYILPITLKTTSSNKSTDITGMVGLGTWITEAEFKDFKVIDNKTKRTLFADNFKDSYGKWQIVRGMWNIENGIFSQTSNAENCYAVAGDSNWSNYTIQVKARKVSGSEGFLIIFGLKDSNNYYWWNIGGWGNTTTAIERCVNGTKYIVGKSANVTVMPNKWYDIKIELNGNRIKCYLDGKLIHDVVDNMIIKDIYANASIDSNSDIIIKVVNISSSNRKVRINLNGIAQNKINPEGTAIVLTSSNLEDENSFEQPNLITPKTKKIKGISNSFDYTFDKYSVTVLRIKTKK